MNKKYLISIPTFILILALILAGCGSGQTTTTATPTPYPTPVRTTYTVQRGDILIDTELFGRVTPLALHTVYFEMSGHVSEVYAQINDTVTTGQLLGELVELQDLQVQATSTRNEIRRAEIALEVAQLTLEQYRSESRPGYQVRIQELQVELAQMTLNETYEKFGIDPEAASLDKLEAQVAKAKVYSPADGMIISAVSPGRSVSPTTVAFVIGDGSQLEIVADLDATKGDDQVKEMFEGMPVVVSPNDRPDIEWTGAIRQLPSPYGTGDPDSGKVYIVLDVPASADTYQTGDTVTVKIELANKNGILWLPPEAIRQVGGRTFVIINSEEGPKRVDIEIGLKTSERVEIVSGLVEGQVVIGQ